MHTPNTKSTEKYYDAIVRELDWRFRKAGYGRKKEVLARLGLNPGYLRTSNRRRSLKLMVLIELAEALGTNLAEIVMAAQHPPSEWRSEPPVGEVSAALKHIVRDALELSVSDGAQGGER